jgi:hypothetical protein
VNFWFQFFEWDLTLTFVGYFPLGNWIIGNTVPPVFNKLTSKSGGKNGGELSFLVRL